MLSTGYSLYFENAAVRVLEHPKGFAIFQYKPGPRTLTDLQAALTHLGNLLRQRQWQRLLGDQRQMVAFSEQETTWMLQHWQAFVQQYAHGLHTAVLVARDAFARLAASQLRHQHQAAALDVTCQLFEEEAPAVAWLAQLSRAEQGQLSSK